ncbi:MAG: membrane protein insertase YidC, partial [Halieaceae bacterium]|nr:membrane protein insertase YidC [Halieaceae bacterium]
MDIQRFFLIGLSAMLAYLLLIEWREFTDENQRSENISPILAPSYFDEYSDPEPLIQHPTKKTSFEELPEVINEPKEIKSLSSTKFSETISVETDVLVLTIDLNGGDIIEAKLKKFPASLENLNQPFELLENNDRRVYLAQSGLTGKNGIDTREGRANFKANSDEFILSPSASELKIDLLWVDKNGISITKRFSLRKGDYLLDVEYLIENQSDTPWEAMFFAQIKRDSSPQPSKDQGGMGLQPFLGAATTLPDKRFAKFTFDDIADEPLKMQSSEGWIAMVQHYFLSAWIPSGGQKHQYSTRQTPSGFNIAGFTSPTTIVEPGQTASVGAAFYVGPKDQYRLEEIAPYLDLSVDYGWLWWIAQPLFWLLHKIHSFVGNWGFSIIILTILIKGAFFQLSATSFKSMANMRRVQPKMLSIREQYPDDKQKQSQAMMELYKKE